MLFIKTLVVLGLSWGAEASVSHAIPDLASAAEYYFSKHEYSEAFSLWSRVYQAQPSSIEAMLRVSELQLLLEGHEPAQRMILDFLKKREKELTISASKAIDSRLGEMQSRFLKDESQSLYFRALSKMKLDDFSQGLVLLEQANKLEGGNQAILVAMADCQKRLGLFSKYHQTLKNASQISRLNRQWNENLLEADFYFKDYESILSWQRAHQSALMTDRQRIVLGLTFLEQGKEHQAVYFLWPQKNSKLKPSDYPIRWYGLGKALMKQPSFSKVALQHFETFLSSFKQPVLLPTEGWDPYRSQEKIIEVKDYISQLNQRR